MNGFRTQPGPAVPALLTIVTMLCGMTIPGAAQTVSALAPSITYPDAAPHRDWPRQLQCGAATIMVYQPQHTRWENDTLTGRIAVSVQTAASPIPGYGVIWYTSHTDVDKQAGTVVLTDYQITKYSLPKPGAGEPDYLEALRKTLPTTAKAMPVERLEASLAASPAVPTPKPDPVENPVPHIIFSTSPAILVLVDGEPALRRIPDSDLLRVINTRALLLQDPSTSRFYLYLTDHWVESAALGGPWTITRREFTALDRAKQALSKGDTVDLLDQPNPEVSEALNNGIEPTVYVSTVPAELIQTEGQPKLQAIPGTKLLWVQNTSANLFMDSAGQQDYVLISGRWFRAPSLSSSNWTYVPAKSLPADFARIPETHPSADALPCVPGTPEAQQARIANSIPQTCTVRRDCPPPNLEYDGDPQFEDVSGTSCQYAKNCPTPVICVRHSAYYACQDGVWFTGPSPTGR